jgi:Fur family peroxide stress response transcriptional regulator
MASPKTNDSPTSPSEHHTDLRLTPQRREVLDILMEKRDHPTATEVFMRAKTRMPSISLATVYNCLEALTHAGYVRQVNMDRAPSRYCPNLKDHAHFYCDSCGNISDVELQPGLDMREYLIIPNESVVSKCDIILHGRCPECTQKTN